MDITQTRAYQEGANHGYDAAVAGEPLDAESIGILAADWAAILVERGETDPEPMLAAYFAYGFLIGAADATNELVCEAAEDGGPHFADPGGRSALRAGVRDQPCPTCGRPGRLTAEDVRLHYQCDSCADRAEGLVTGADY
jgi:hypothetical protein